MHDLNFLRQVIFLVQLNASLDAAPNMDPASNLTSASKCIATFILLFVNFAKENDMQGSFELRNFLPTYKKLLLLTAAVLTNLSESAIL